MYSKIFITSTAILAGITLGTKAVSAHACPPANTRATWDWSTSVEVQSSSIEAPQRWNSLKVVLNQQLGKPYLWGATGLNAFDCSGLTQYVFKNAVNINLQRTAEQQFHQFRHVAANQVRPGDLIFFSYNHGQSIDHVGIIADGPHMMIDAQSNGVVKENFLAPWWQSYIAGYARVLE